MYCDIEYSKLDNGAKFSHSLPEHMFDSENVDTGNKCIKKLCLELRKKIFPAMSDNLFDSDGDLCFCNYCHRKRNDKLVYSRGKPPKRYVLLIGWCRFVISMNEGLATTNRVFKEWHVSYHGTKKQCVTSIFSHGCLLKAGDVAMDGKLIEIPKGHIQESFLRENEYTGERERFNPKQSFTSPSIKYASHKAYAKPYEQGINGSIDKCYQIQFVFQCRQKPDSYKVGHATTRDRHKIDYDEFIDNNSIEWYTDRNQCVMLTGFLMKVEIVKRKAKQG